MRNPVLNILTLIALLSLCGVSAFVMTVYFNPESGLNPFPPPTMPVGIILPSETPTPQSMPPTWTPGPGTAAPTIQALAPSSTPMASATGFILPTYTPTPTATDTETPTPTITETSEPTNTPKPTKTPVPVSIDIQVADISVVSGSASGPTVVLHVKVQNNSTNKVTATFSNSFALKKMTKISWTCTTSSATCKNGSASKVTRFSTSVTMNGSGSVDFTITATFPGVTAAFNTTAQITASGNYQGNTHDAKTQSIPFP